jgi:hypothetical protein
VKVSKFIILFLLVGFLVPSVCADEINPLVYHYYNPEVTVEFSEPLQISPESQQSIADKLAGVISNTLIDPNVASPENIICTIFGHDLAPESTVIVTRHKVRQHAPRCLKEVYHVTYCQRCDYTVTELHNDFYVFCCPED